MLSISGCAIGNNANCTVVVETLPNINLYLREGDCVGLVSYNGAGKSSLPRPLSDIYEPTRHSADARGNVAPSSTSVWAWLRGLRLWHHHPWPLPGQSTKQTKSRLDEIVEFTKLGYYFAMPLRTYPTSLRSAWRAVWSPRLSRRFCC